VTTAQASGQTVQFTQCLFPNETKLPRLPPPVAAARLRLYGYRYDFTAHPEQASWRAAVLAAAAEEQPDAQI